MLQPSKFLALLSLAVFSTICETAQAVRVNPEGDPTVGTTAAKNDLGWKYTGAVSGASGVYLGKYGSSYYVLTANHVGGGSFFLEGNNYDYVSGSYQQVAPAVDLGVFAIVGTSQLDALTNLVIGSNTLTTDSRLNMIGYGGGIKRGGYNTGEYPRETISYSGYTETALVTDWDIGEAQATGGDSGGGVFFQNGPSLELSGIMVAIDDGLNTFTYSVFVQSYRSEILTIVPEASMYWGWLFCGIFGAAQFFRHRRKQHDLKI